MAAGLTLTLGGCGQVTVGEGPPAGSGTATTTGPLAAPDPTPGPDATPGCEELVAPVHRLVTGAGDTGANSAEVRRLADGVEDNALSALSSRLSGLVAQDEVDPVVVDAQWDQFRQLCDLP